MPYCLRPKTCLGHRRDYIQGQLVNLNAEGPTQYVRDDLD